MSDPKSIALLVGLIKMAWATPCPFVFIPITFSWGNIKRWAFLWPLLMITELVACVPSTTTLQPPTKSAVILAHTESMAMRPPPSPLLPKEPLGQFVSGQATPTPSGDMLVFKVKPFESSFHTQALALAQIKYLRIWVRGAGISAQMWNKEGYAAVGINPNNLTLQIPAVPKGRNRIVTAQGFDSNQQPIPGAILKGYYSSTATQQTVIVLLKWRFWVSSQILECLLDSHAPSLTGLDIGPIQTLLEQTIYGSNPIDGSTYAVHPLRFDACALATHIQNNPGGLSATTLAESIRPTGTVTLNVKTPQGTTFNSSIITLSIADPISASVAMLPGTGTGTVSNVAPGTWNIRAAISGLNGGVQTNATVTVDNNGTVTLGSPFLTLPPVLTQINSTSGAIGSSITLIGDGFDPIPGNNTVKFGTIIGTVTAASPTALTVIIPDGVLGSTPLTVTAGGQTSNTGTLNVTPTIYIPPCTAGNCAVTTVAGNVAGNADGVGTSAQFNNPYGLVTSSSGNLLIVDLGNNLIRQMTSAGVVTTFAGSGVSGNLDGTGTAAQFRSPTGIAMDSNGNFYVAGYVGHNIRKITPAGVVTTLAGNGGAGFADGTGTLAQFNEPTGVAVDSNGNVYVADYRNHRIRKITPAGVVTTLAGSGVAGFADGTGVAAQFNFPHSLTIDSGENLYVSDYANHRIRKITPAGVVTTLAGSGAAGFANGTGVAAQFNGPLGIKIDSNGDLYVADYANHRIRKITPAGVVTTYAGSGAAGVLDGAQTTAQFNNPADVAIDSNGNVYVADRTNMRIRKISKDPLVTTLAGSGVAGFADGTGAAAQFNRPNGIAIDSNGNLYVADSDDNRIRKITPAGVVTTLAGSGVAGFADATGAAAQFSYPSGIAVDSSGNVYVGDHFNHRVRKITPAGVVTTLAGSGVAGFADATGAAAQFTRPSGVAVDSSGNVYVGDHFNHRVRKITPAGVVTTLAGSGVAGFADATGTLAQFNGPAGVAVDSSGNVYVTDYSGHRIRKITPAGVVSTLAGSGVVGFANGTGTLAQFNIPTSLALDSSGNLYITDHLNHRVRKITSAGVVTTYAGSGTAGFADTNGMVAQFNGPAGIVIDSSGNLYVTDYNNSRVRKLTL